MIGEPVEVLVVGAGPTGLSLAAELVRHGVVPRVVDRSADRVHESRALAIQPRTLEVLARLGLGDPLARAGNPAVRLRLHAGRREVTLRLFDLGLADTAYPHLLFLSQSETERVLEEHLATAGLTVQRRVEVVALRPGDDAVTVDLRHADGHTETIEARYVVGCDGARSTVREAAGIAFVGSSYPQTFVLADCRADGLADGEAHAFLTQRGMMFFFPLGTPAPWRLLAMRPSADTTPAAVSVDELRDLAAAYTQGAVRPYDPLWMTNFRLHHRAAERYRAGRVFLAGDAAHVHSPAGGQGMNTGIQDAVNLGWKLAYTIRGLASRAVLDTYEAERAPVGRLVLRFTDRAFTVATSTNPFVRLARTHLAPLVLPLVLRPRRFRAYAFRTVSQLAIHYRDSPLSTNGHRTRRRGPGAGDRMPDVAVVHDGQSTTLHRVLAPAGWHLLVAGAELGDRCERLVERFENVTLRRVVTDASTDGLVLDATVRGRLGLDDCGGLLLVRPDGHLGYRSGPAGLAGLGSYLERWTERG